MVAALPVHEEGGDAKITIGNPCLVVDEAEGVVWLLFTRDNDRVLATSSRDEGRTWSRPRDITPEVKREDWTWYATGPGNGIQLNGRAPQGPAGDPLRPSRRGHPRPGAGLAVPRRLLRRPRPDVARRRRDPGTHERVRRGGDDGRPPPPQHAAASAGRPGGGWRPATTAALTWSPVEDDPTLVEPVCQASLIRYSWGGPGEKSRLLFSNPAHPKRRENLTVRLSDDEGRTWPVRKTIWKGSAIYSSLARLPDGAIGLLYEREDYRRIVFTRFTLAWLTEGGLRDEGTPP